MCNGNSCASKMWYTVLVILYSWLCSAQKREVRARGKGETQTGTENGDYDSAGTLASDHGGGTSYACVT